MAGDGSVFDRLDEDFGWSPRQREVLDLLARGRTNAQVAETLGISLDGAKWHVREVLSKPGVDSREQAAEYWRAYNGWRRRGPRGHSWRPVPSDGPSLAWALRPRESSWWRCSSVRAATRTLTPQPGSWSPSPLLHRAGPSHRRQRRSS